MKVSLEKQIELYDSLNARHTISDYGIDDLTWKEIMIIVRALADYKFKT